MNKAIHRINTEIAFKLCYACVRVFVCRFRFWFTPLHSHTSVRLLTRILPGVAARPNCITPHKLRAQYTRPWVFWFTSIYVWHHIRLPTCTCSCVCMRVFVQTYGEFINIIFNAYKFILCLCLYLCFVVHKT